MLNETIQVSSNSAHDMFQIVEGLAGLDEPGLASISPGDCDADICARALQALRDVRHLLPLEGVAIVDEVLDVAT